jgi:hypothetical protein
MMSSKKQFKPRYRRLDELSDQDETPTQGVIEKEAHLHVKVNGHLVVNRYRDVVEPKITLAD